MAAKSLSHTSVQSSSTERLGQDDNPYGDGQSPSYPSSTIPLQDLGSTTYHPLAPSSPWRTGIWRRFPWPAFFAILVALVAVIVMISILVISDGQEISKWKFSPAVYLAIASAVANILLVFALNRGTEVAFWVKAMEPKTTFKELHNIWRFGTSFRHAVISGRSFNWVAMAGIAVALAPINGPLLQRASTVTTAEVTKFDRELKVPAAQEFPHGYTGTISGRSHTPSFLSSNFSAVLKDYTLGKVFNLTTESGCSGRCFGTIQAAGYKMNCAPSSFHFNISLTTLLGENSISGNGSAFQDVSVFATNFTYLEYGDDYTTDLHESLNYTSAIKTNNDCAGDLQVQKCSLFPAILTYQIILTNNSISLDPNYSYRDDKLVKFTPAMSNPTQGPTTHGGMGLALSSMFDSESTMAFNGAVGYRLDSTGIPTFKYSNSAFDPFDFNCSITWQDPTDDMLATARELAFRTALSAANLTNTTNIQRFRGDEHYTATVYESHYLFLALALSFTVISTLCLIPLFFGFWKLGRRVTLSPIEIARAFDAPVLSSSDSNTHVDALLDEVGKQRIRYGAVEEALHPIYQSAEKLVMGDPNRVAPPQEGKLFVG